MEIHAVEALTDNYMYLIIDPATREAAAIDPADADEMIAAAAKVDAKIKTVLTTHHHFDHAGGNNDMKRLLPDVVIVGGAQDPVQAMTKAVNDGDKLQVGSGLTVSCIHTPCHTAGHMAFLVSAAAGPSAVFTGDVLFVGGCGRFFEGGPEDMCGALAKLARLPPDTKVYVGHEYTIKNFDFAYDVEPQNDALVRKIEWAHATRKKGGAPLGRGAVARKAERSARARAAPQASRPRRPSATSCRRTRSCACRMRACAHTAATPRRTSTRCASCATRRTSLSAPRARGSRAAGRCPAYR